MHRYRARAQVLAVAVCSTATLASAQDVITQEQLDELEHSHSRLTDVPLGLQYHLVPDRPQPLLEIGNPYQGTGVFEENIFTKTGAVLQPSLLLWGTYRTAFNATADENGSRDVSEWANRLDLFGEYKLTGTERVVIGFRPLDKDGLFQGYDFEDGSTNQEFNGNVRTLFFEGDFGEIFPKLDPDDSRGLDYGFSIGRQPLLFQNGVMINDTLDAVGVTRNSKRFWGFSNVRFTGLVAWDDIDRGSGFTDEDATILAFLTEVDTKDSTIELDVALGLSGDGSDGTYAGYGSTQRIGHYNTTFRANVSVDMDDVGAASVDDGLLLSAEVSKTLHHSEDLVYLNTFLGIDSYRSAAQDPASAGPLAATGILFAGTGIGTAGSALGGLPDDSVAAAFGIQKFFNGGREQLTGELGGRYNYDAERGALAAGGRWQRAWGQHTVFAVDLYAGFDDAGGATGGFDGAFAGTRLEMLIKF
ncbi:MAG: hypothetical protein ACI8QZ_002394 [Chlamydiales bacterium]|jgi:hypothetical protein